MKVQGSGKVLVAASLMAMGLLCGHAYAGSLGPIVVAVPGNLTAAAGSINNSFDVTLTNSGADTFIVGSYAFHLSVSDPNVTFTSATTATVSFPAIFNTHSMFGPTISTSLPGQSLDASDMYSFPGGLTIGQGVTLGLGHVFFNVAANTPASSDPIIIAASPLTNVKDQNGNSFFLVLQNGNVRITAATTTPVPLPAAVWQGGAVLAALAGFAALRRRRVA